MITVTEVLVLPLVGPFLDLMGNLRGREAVGVIFNFLGEFKREMMGFLDLITTFCVGSIKEPTRRLFTAIL